jgi:outer membrane immunogenic protein
MKRILIASAALVALTAGAVAADLPQRTQAPAPFVPVAPAFTWAGFYAGVNAVYAWGDFTCNGGALSEDADGFVGGGQLGYNAQFGQFVVGLETDLQWMGFDADRTVVGGLPVGSEASLDYFGTVRARAGVALDRTLIFATGGFAYGGSDVTIAGVGSDDNTHVGWTVGGGAEYAFTNNLTFKGEYLYTDLDEETVVIPGVAPVQAGAEFSTVRAGVNYKF